MTPTEAEDRLAALRPQIAHHNERYHTLDDPEISDADYDDLVRELRAIEAEHPELVALDEALEVLAGFAPRQSRIVEMRFFGGLTIDETAKLLGISPATVKLDWSLARAWLLRELGRG